MTEWLLEVLVRIKQGEYVPDIRFESSAEDIRAAENIVIRFQNGGLFNIVEIENTEKLIELVFVGYVSVWLKKTPEQEIAYHLWRAWQTI